MPYTVPLTAIADGVYALFQDATLLALATGGVHTDIPPGDKTYPLLWFEVLHQGNQGGLGTKPGRGSMPVCTLRLHVFQSEYGTARDAQLMMAKAIELVFIPGAIALTGYTLAGNEPLPEIETIPLPFEELGGVKVSELVTNIDLIVEEIA